MAKKKVSRKPKNTRKKTSKRGGDAQDKKGGKRASAPKGGPEPSRTSNRQESTPAHSVTDTVTTRDTLGFELYVDAIATFLLNDETHPPLTLSIEGEWGSGKTSFMRQLAEKVRKKGAKVIEFNPWRHDKEDSLWCAFALKFIDELSWTMSYWKRVLCAVRLTIARFGWASGIWEILRLGFVLLAWIVVAFVLLRRWIPDVNASINDLVTSNDVDQWLRTLLSPLAGPFGSWIVPGGGWFAALGGSYWLFRQINEKLGNPFRNDLRKYLKSIDYAERISFVEKFHKDFGKIANIYGGGDKVFVFIDDLDRCEIPKAAELMQSINLMIDTEPPLIFVLGLDREKVAAGLAVKYEALHPYLQRVGDSNHRGQNPKDVGIRFGYDFIEKFVQLPFRVPEPPADVLDGFLDGLATKTAHIESQPSLASSTRVKISSFIENVLRRLRVRLARMRSPLGDGLGFSDNVEVEVVSGRKFDWDEFQLTIGRESESVREIIKMVAPTMGNNPRRLIQFVNAFRLKAYIAFRSGLLNSEDGVEPIHLEQLGKFVAIGLRWPLLMLEITDDPDLLRRLARYVGSGKENTPPLPTDNEPLTDTEERWMADTQLLDLIDWGCKSGSPANQNVQHFAMTELNVEKLLHVCPAFTPQPPRREAPAEAPVKEPRPNESTPDPTEPPPEPAHLERPETPYLYAEAPYVDPMPEFPASISDALVSNGERLASELEVSMAETFTADHTTEENNAAVVYRIVLRVTNPSTLDATLLGLDVALRFNDGRVSYGHTKYSGHRIRPNGGTDEFRITTEEMELPLAKPVSVSVTAKVSEAGVPIERHIEVGGWYRPPAPSAPDGPKATENASKSRSLTTDEVEYLMDISRPRNEKALSVSYIQNLTGKEVRYTEMIERFVEAGLVREGTTFYSLTTAGHEKADELWQLRILTAVSKLETGNTYVDDVEIARAVDLTDGKSAQEELVRHIKSLEYRGLVDTLEDLSSISVSITPEGRAFLSRSTNT